MKKISISFSVNRKKVRVSAFPMMRLLDLIREDLALTGTKEGCGEGECGACSVLMDGEIVNSCLVPAIQAEGTRITTIEGLANGDKLNPIQKAFLEQGGAQCGICTPGMIIAVADLLRRHPRPNEEQIKENLAGNLCRCTGYMRIFEAVRKCRSSQGVTKR